MNKQRDDEIEIYTDRAIQKGLIVRAVLISEGQKARHWMERHTNGQ